MANKIVCLLSLWYLISFPGFTFIFLWYHQGGNGVKLRKRFSSRVRAGTDQEISSSNRLNSDDFSLRYGSLYLNIKTDKLSSLCFTLVFLLRRLFLAMMISFVPLSVGQLFAIQASSLIIMVYYIQLKPMDSDTYLLIHLLNECIIYICAVGMVLFTEYIAATEQRWMFGYVFIGFTVACIAVNVFITVWLAILAVKSALKKRKLAKVRE